MYNLLNAQNNYCIEYEHLLHDTRDKYGVSWKVYNKLITNENESATFVRSIDTVFTVNEDDIIEQQASNYSQSEYKNLKKQISFSRTIFPKYNLSDSIYKINWEIKNESKAILGYNCQLAKGSFRGRTYSAYFTTEIPIRNGPQKFDGLPGIILEVVSDDKCVYYKENNHLSLNSLRSQLLGFLLNFGWLIKLIVQAFQPLIATATKEAILCKIIGGLYINLSAIF